MTATDQMGHTLTLENSPKRIVSLVPSQTELLFDLGLDNEIVGVTRFCIHPHHARKTRMTVGGTKKFDLERIIDLKPDLIIGNKEENYPEGINFLRKRFPVWMSDILSLDDALSMITSVSGLTGRQPTGDKLVNEIRMAFTNIKSLPTLRTLYLMWHNPWMGAAPKTFIHEIMTRMGLVNVLADQERYPELDEQTILSLRPELILLSSEPFPFAEKHKRHLRSLLPDSQVMLVNGEYFSWYGSRLRLTAAYAGELASQLNLK